ncbi:hypothetical protein vseg_011552 [Gypsophila vaccaria]
MSDFHDAIDECGPPDLPFVGYGFTYDNRQPKLGNRQSKLDRGLATENWLDLFPYAKVITLGREWSDHTPIKLVLKGAEDTTGRRRRPFRFEQMWVIEDSCEDVIRSPWSREGTIQERIVSCSENLMSRKGSSFWWIFKEL